MPNWHIHPKTRQNCKCNYHWLCLCNIPISSRNLCSKYIENKCGILLWHKCVGGVANLSDLVWEAEGPCSPLRINCHQILHPQWVHNERFLNMFPTTKWSPTLFSRLKTKPCVSACKWSFFSRVEESLSKLLSLLCYIGQYFQQNLLNSNKIILFPNIVHKSSLFVVV